MSVSVKVIFDFSCPYCYLAWGYLKRIKETMDLSVEWTPWEIHPEAPPEGADITSVVNDVNLDLRRNKLNQLGAPVNLAPGNKTFVPNTRLTLQANEFAKTKGQGEAFLDAVFTANFTEGRNIGDKTVILDLAEQVGLDRTELAQALDSSRYLNTLLLNDSAWMEMNIEYVPTILQNGAIVMTGAFTFAACEAALRGLANK